MDSNAGATVQQQYTSTNHAASVSTAPEPTATPSAYTVHHQNQPQHHLLTQHQNQPQHHLLTQHITRTNRNTICLHSTSTRTNRNTICLHSTAPEPTATPSAYTAPAPEPEPTATPSAYTAQHQNQPQHHLLIQHQHLQ